MPISKKELFTPDLQESSILFKALSHPARLSIIQYLAKMKICMTGDITDQIPLGRTTVNQHLAELKKAGLIKGEIDGVKVNYCINSGRIEELKKWISLFFEQLEGCC